MRWLGAAGGASRAAGSADAGLVEGIENDLGVDIATHVIGPRQEWLDLTGDWARANEIRDSGIVLVRPDQHVGWRREAIADDPYGELTRVMKAILDK